MGTDAAGVASGEADAEIREAGQPHVVVSQEQDSSERDSPASIAQPPLLDAAPGTEQMRHPATRSPPRILGHADF